MTLAVPTSRPPFLAETADVYDNPDTPGTSYSFHEQVLSKSIIHTDTSHHLSIPVLDAAMLISTDDEMIDSDNEQRRDEDFDIDLDAEGYFVNDGDMEVNITMEDNSLVYGHIEADIDNDDIMLDDEPTEYHNETLDGTEEAAENTQLDNLPAAPGEVETFLQSSTDREHDQPGPVTESDVQSHAEPHTEPDIEPDTEPHTEPHTELERVLTQPDTAKHFSGEEMAPAPVLQPEKTINRDHQEDYVGQQHPPIAHEEPKSESVTTHENGSSQSSTTTLSHEANGTDIQFPEEDNKHDAVDDSQANNEDIPSASARAEDSYDSSYQYPIIVQYEQNQLTLFPSMTDWSEDPALAAIYSDLPSDYLLPDVGVCEMSICELFMHLRDVLGPSVGLGSELIVEIELLGLHIREDSTVCKSVSLRRILDLHNQLHENDGYEIMLPLNMALYTVPRFYSRLEEISVAVQERKGLQEFLSLIKLPSADNYSNEEGDSEDYAANIADSHEISNSVLSNETQNNSMESLTSVEREILQQHMHTSNSGSNIQPDENININQTTNNSGASELDTGDQKAVCGDSEKPVEAIPNTGDPCTTSQLPQATVIDSIAIPPIVQPNTARFEDEEELLEYEDDDDVQAATVQPELEDSMIHRNKDELSAKGDVKEYILDANDDSQQSPKDDSAPIQLPIGGYAGEDAGEDEQLSSTTTVDDQPKVPSNLDARSNLPLAIPVFGGDDEDEGEYNNQQQGYNTLVYDHEEHLKQYHENPPLVTDANFPSIKQNFDNGQEVESIESYVEESFQGDDFTIPEDQSINSNRQDGKENNGSGYYDENEGEYMEQEETEYTQGNAEGFEDEYEYVEYDDSHFGNANIESPEDVEVVSTDPSLTDAIDIVTHSPVPSTHDEELIDYEDDDEGSLQLHKAKSDLSLKRLREDFDQRDDSELNDNQAPKRARAE